MVRVGWFGNVHTRCVTGVILVIGHDASGVNLAWTLQYGDQVSHTVFTLDACAVASLHAPAPCVDSRLLDASSVKTVSTYQHRGHGDRGGSRVGSEG